MLNHNKEAMVKAKLAAEESARCNEELQKAYAANDITVVSLTEPDPNTGERRLKFEIPNGAPVESKHINKVDGEWREVECAD